MAQQQAVDQGCDQVVWLDAAEHRWVEEMGGMNLFFVFGAAGGQGPQLMTPALTGTLLPGITRDSLLRLAPELGIKASEDRISVEEWRDAVRVGRADRGVRLRDRRRGDPGRTGQGRLRRMAGRRRRARPGDHAPAR